MNTEKNEDARVSPETNQTEASGKEVLDSKSLKVFAFGDSIIRLVTRENEPWFIANDLCNALGLTNQSKTVSSLDDDERGRVTISYPPHGQRETNIVSEVGMYSLTLRSRKPEAKQFKRWITHEVLPQIRKTGAYTANPDLTAIVQRLDAMQAQITAHNPPYVVNHHEYEPTGTVVWTITAVSERLRNAGIPVTAKDLYRYLIEIGWVEKRGKRYAPCESEALLLGYVIGKTVFSFIGANGKPYEVKRAYISETGYRELKKRFSRPDALLKYQLTDGAVKC